MSELGLGDKINRLTAKKFQHNIMIRQTGFTLIEMSIVLVIIGLIIGGILVGQDLIAASQARAQISQIEKYNSAVNTFHNKYGGIPGDLTAVLANQFGFTVGASCTGAFLGTRDGNGLLDGNQSPWIYTQAMGETGLFWQDLSLAGLIDGEYPNNGAAALACLADGPTLTLTPGTAYIGDYFPVARIGNGNFVYVYEKGGNNWYGVSAITTVPNSNANIVSSTTIPVIQAYNVDKKVDDGVPTTGSVQAVYLNGSNAATFTVNAQASDSTTSCYNTANNAYSISASANQGAGLNCALSFRFQ